MASLWRDWARGQVGGSWKEARGSSGHRRPSLGLSPVWAETEHLQEGLCVPERPGFQGSLVHSPPLGGLRENAKELFRCQVCAGGLRHGCMCGCQDCTGAQRVGDMHLLPCAGRS